MFTVVGLEIHIVYQLALWGGGRRGKPCLEQLLISVVQLLHRSKFKATDMMSLNTELERDA